MTDVLKDIRLYGKLGALFGRDFRLAVASPAEAMQALCAVIPGFRQYVATSHTRGIKYAVLAGKRSLTLDELTHPSGDDMIRIAPVIGGRKNGGILNILVGAVMIVVGVVIGVGSAGTAGVIAVGLVGSGIAMIAGGVIQLLSPKPRGITAEDRPENRPSYNFNGAVNTTVQGNPVPLLYGRGIVGSAVVSAGITAKDEVYVPTGGGRAGGGAAGGGTARFADDWSATTVEL